MRNEIIKAASEIDIHLESIRNLESQVVEQQCKIGKIILSRFYSDDPKRYYSKHPQKEFSLRKLCNALLFKTSKSSLQRCIIVYITSLELGNYKEWKHLTSAHILAIHKLVSIDQKIDAMKKIATEALSPEEYTKQLSVVKENNYKEEHNKILTEVSASISRILLSEDRISKHKPWTWLEEPTETHLLKAARHIMTYLNIQAGGQKPSDENHLDNAITRLSMAIAQLSDVKG